METNNQVVTGENNLPEVIQNQKGITVAVLGNASAHRILALSLVETAESMVKIVESLQRNLPKNIKP